MAKRTIELNPHPNVADGDFLKTFNFTEIVEKADGSVDVWGVATWEKPDSDNEICDYDTAVPVYRKWSGDAAKRTKKAGQDISLGNIRVMHSGTLGGKATKIEFDDDEKEIRVGSEPASDEIHDLLKGGFLTGYSQGGSYAWRKCEKCGGQMPMQQGYNFCETCGKSGLVRYGLKRMAELSYVDSPAIMEGFIYVKANGSQQIIKFQNRADLEDTNVANKNGKTKRVAGVDLPAHCFAYVGDPDKTATWKLPIEFPNDDEKTKRHIRNALARFEQTKGIPADKKAEVKAKIESAARSHGIEVDGDGAQHPKADAASIEIVRKRIAERALLKKFDNNTIEKGLYAVSNFAQILNDLAYMYEMAVYEREVEGDESAVPDDLKEILDMAIDTFISMATEEARELAANNKKLTTNQGDNPMAKTAEEIQQEQEAVAKAAKKSLASHFAKAANHHEKRADHHEKLAASHEEFHAIHKAAHEHHEAMHAKCAAAKADVSTEEPHASIAQVLSDQQEHHKAMSAHHKGLMKCHKADVGTHTAIAKAHDKHAEHYNSMADAHDEESAKAVREEMKKADAADALANPATPSPTTPITKTGSDALSDDVQKAIEAGRETPEYKASIAAIAKAKLDAEIADLAGVTLAPTGTGLPREKGLEIIKGLHVVARPAGEDKDFEFAGSSRAASSSGL